MRNLIIFLSASLLFIGNNVSGQTKELTLSDAILKQYTELRPNRARGLIWLNANTYIQVKGNGADAKLISYDLKKGKESTLKSIAEFKELMAANGAEVSGFPRFSYTDENMLIFSVKGVYYRWNVKKDKIESFENETEGVSDVHFNSDGSAMAYVKENNVFRKEIGGQAVQVTSAGTEDIVYGKAASRFEFGIMEGIFWSKGDALAYYRNDQSAVTTYPLVDYTTTPASLNPIKYPMAGGPSEKVSLEVYSEGKKVTMKTDVEKDAYICSINWTPNGEEIILVTLNRDQNHSKFQRFNAATGELIGVEYEEKDEKYVEPLHPLTFLNDDGSEYIYLSQKDGWMHAYHKKGESEKQLTKGEWVITKILGLSSDKKHIYFEGTGENATDNEIYKVDIANAESKRISKNRGTYHASLSPGTDYFIIRFSNIDVPGNTLIADSDGIVKKDILKSTNPLEEYKVSKPELMTITNKGGAILHARMIKPHDFDEKKKYPALVYVYNGPHVQLIKNRWWGGAPLWMNYFAEKGYIVFTVDGRGSYNRGKEFEQVTFRNLGEFEMLDQLDAAEYLKGLDYVDGDRLAVHGWSYGGYMTTSLMLIHPNYFKVGVAGGPVTSWKYYEVMYTERYMDTPETNPEGFMKTDLSNHVMNLQGKLLLIHGLSDDVVVPQHNFNLVKRFVDEGIQVDFFPYNGHPHNVRGKDRVHLMEKVLTYIEENL